MKLGSFMPRSSKSKVKLIKQRCEHPGPTPEFFTLDDNTTLTEKLELIAENVPGMLYLYRLRPDGTSHFPFTTDGIRQIYAVSPDEVAEDCMCVFERLHPEDIEEIGRTIVESATQLTPWDHTYRVCHPDGKVIWVRGHATPQKLSDGSVLWHGYIMDVTEARESEIALRQRERHLRAMIEAEPECVKVVSSEGELLDMNAAGLAMIEVDTLEEARSFPLFDLLIEEHIEPYTEAHKRALGGKPTSLEFEIIGRKGTHRWMDSRMVPLVDEDGSTSVLSITRDVTDQKKLEHDLLAAARIDRLTGLCNRNLLMERLQAHLDQNDVRPFALLFLDVDRFKLVNDSMGHHVGDQMLLEVATRLQRVVRSTDSLSAVVRGNTVARLGGDEFVLLIENVKSPKHVADIANRILESLRKPYSLGGRRIVTDASIGVVYGGTDYNRAEEIIRDADTAMYEAKRSGRGRYVFFDPQMRARIQWLVALEDELRRSLDHQEFCVIYQPIVELESAVPCGYEALVRWLHPIHGVVSPADFIPIAEDTGLILPLGDFVFRQSVMDARRWKDNGVSAYVSINLSPHQLTEPIWISRFENHLAIAGIEASRVQLEITESTVMHDFDRAVEILNHLRACGFSIALDDFGTGYSSLAWLHRLPIDVLKFDRSFISQMQGQVFTLMRGLVSTAHDLGIRVIAEGVETEAQRELLMEIGCRYGQGYFFGRPAAADKIIDWRSAA